VRSIAAIAIVPAFCVATGARADLIVPPGAVFLLDGGTTDLQCTDLVVGGTLRLATGSIANARHVTIKAGGSIEGQSGVIALGGNWSNDGQFIAGASVVRFRDLCSLATSGVSGNTTFATASFVSAIGKGYAFAAGSTQSVSGVLEIAGTAAAPIQFRSSAPGNVASIDLLPDGSQPIQHVGVTDVWATGQWLAPQPANEGGGGNANRWFGQPVEALPVPTLGAGWLAALALGLAAFASFALRREERDGNDRGESPAS
jgi:hypothetical protein